MTDEYFIKICKESITMATASRKLGMAYGTFIKKAKRLGCYTPNQAGVGINKSRVSLDDILNNKITVGQSTLKRNVMASGLLELKCSNPNCGVVNEWLGGKLTLELDHIDGNNLNNNLSNLRLLCPNCHSQTPTFRRKNKGGNGSKRTYSDNNLIVAVKTSTTISEVCTKVGIGARGGNFKTIKTHMVRLGISLKEKDDGFKVSKCGCGSIKSKRAKRCKSCDGEYRIRNRRVVRPPYERLVKEIEETNYCAVGRKYGVSDNAIRKWLS